MCAAQEQVYIAVSVCHALPRARIALDRHGRGRVHVRRFAVTGDVVLEDEEKRQLYVGFVNRAGVPKGEGSLAFEVTKVIGNVPLTRDGVRKNNLLGISLIGPLLLKNPKIAESFVKIICERKGAEYKEISYPHSEKSHDKTKKALLNAEV